MYEQADLASQAAVLAHGIAEGQCFIDGNKRIAYAAMRSFLLINGYELTAPREEFARRILDFNDPTTGETIETLATRIRANIIATRFP